MSPTIVWQNWNLLWLPIWRYQDQGLPVQTVRPMKKILFTYFPNSIVSENSNIFVPLYTQSSLYMYKYSLLRLQILSLTHAHIRGHIRYPFLTHALSLSHFLIFTRTVLSDISCAKLGETVWAVCHKSVGLWHLRLPECLLEKDLFGHNQWHMSASDSTC